VEINRIKLLKFVHTFDIGGTERHVVNLAQRLDRDQFDLSFGCLYKTGPFLKDVERLQIPVEHYHVASLRSGRALKEGLRCAGQIRSNGIDIVHTYGFYPNMFAIPAASLAGASAIVASIRDTGDICTPKQCRMQKLVCHFADCILVNAEAIRQKLIADGYKGAKIKVIKNGIDLSRFEKAHDQGKLRYEYRLSPDAPLVMMLARLSVVKGIEYFLEAAAITAQRFENARFLIVGDLKDDHHDYRETLKRQADRLGLARRVIFTGFRLNVAEVLAEATVSVLPSLAEGLSNTLLESMAAGLPIVATSVGGNPEVVEDGATGLLVPPRDSDALARAISRLLAHAEMARRFGAAGRQRVARHFSLERMTQDTEGLYRQLLETARRRTASANGDGRFSRRWHRSRNPLRAPR
jgi:glycosyltransferase involved in cell wall biosynthesis